MSNPFVDNFNANNMKMENVSIEADDEDLGALQGAVNITENIEKYNLEIGVPKVSFKKFLQKMVCKVAAQLLELTANSVCFGLGISRTMREDWDGTTEYDRFFEAAAEDQQVRQFRQGRNSGWERIKLAHKNIKTTGGEQPVIKVWPGTVTPWSALKAYTKNQIVEPVTPGNYYYICTTAGTSGSVEPTWGVTPDGTTSDGTAVWTCKAWVVGVANTDYVLDAKNGEVYILPGSTFTSKTKVYCKYKAVPAESEVIPLKQTGFLAWEGPVTVTGTDVSSGTARVLDIWRADVKSTGIKTSSNAPWVVGIEINALNDPDHPSNPLGKWREGVIN